MTRRIMLVMLWAGLLAGCDGQAPPVALTPAPTADWTSWAGAPGGGHYTPLAQIAPDNVASLELVWEHRSGDFRQGTGMRDDDIDMASVRPATAFQATPLLVEDTLYYCTPYNRVFALDPVTGAERWSHDPEIDTDSIVVSNCRGVSSWIDPQREAGEACRHRIFAPTLDGRIIALDGDTGERCSDFADGGQIDLTAGLGEHAPRDYAITSPPAIIGETLVTGAFVIDAWDVNVPAGVVRAFDVRSGALRWAWNPVAPGRAPQRPDGTYERGTTNVWSVISVDPDLGLVYVPTGNSSPDYYGGHREGHLDHYSSSVVALDADTGEVAWHVQTVHHDIWDYDVPAQPTLVDLNLDGETVPALVQMTKMGLTWVLDRRTGAALFEIEERAVPQTGAVAGEYLAPTQPIPLRPAPLLPLDFGPDDAWGFTFWDEGACRDAIEALDHQGIYTPISERGTVFYPAPVGGNNWGTPAIDPRTGIMVVNTTRMPMEARLLPREQCGQPGREMPQTGVPYCVRMELLASPFGAPCSAPPWSTLDAIDLASGEQLWSVPLGSFEGVIPLVGGMIEGGPGFGGQLLTASGLVLTAASTDAFLRAFDVRDGSELARFELPTLAASVPMSYRVEGDPRQFVVLAVGGHWAGIGESSDHLMAFALRAAER